ncbi:F-box protein At5g49610 [Linum grandiflorum]
MADEFFPDEVILQILSRLPVKSLFQARAVSRRWYSLSTDKYFVQLYNKSAVENSKVLVDVTDPSESISKSSLICVDNLAGVSELSLDFLPDRVKIRASCNGLLCCSCVPDKGLYYVCNPVTRQFRTLPRARERPVTRFYPDSDPTLVGLGCDLSSQKFNVVLAFFHRTFGHRPDGTFVCFVFDSETNRWRKFVSIQDDHFTHMNRNQVVFVNNSLHWLTGSCSFVLALDLECEVWRKISLPDEVSYGVGNRVYLLELDGCLSVVQISEAWMKIWEMKDYESEVWSVVDRVSLRCIRGMVPGIFPISQTREFVFMATHKQVLVYNRRSRVWKEMYSLQTSSSPFPLWFSAHAFRTTIFPCN